MEYSIRELSQLSGVTTRTLRWYDEIGLLKPAYVAESGYRYYREAEVDRLQDILYYRELECRKLRLDQLIQSVKDTIYEEEKQEMMNDEQKFEAFKKRAVEKHEECYGQEAREKYGDREVDEVQETMKNLTREQYQEWTCLGEEILQRLEAAVTKKVSPQSDEGRDITALHRRWLTLTGNRYDKEKHKGIANLYIMDERFTAYYDRKVTGCAQFLRDAVVHWV